MKGLWKVRVTRTGSPQAPSDDCLAGRSRFVLRSCASLAQRRHYKTTDKFVHQRLHVARVAVDLECGPDSAAGLVERARCKLGDAFGHQERIGARFRVGLTTTSKNDVQRRRIESLKVLALQHAFCNFRHIAIPFPSIE